LRERNDRECCVRLAGDIVCRSSGRNTVERLARQALSFVDISGCAQTRESAESVATLDIGSGLSIGLALILALHLECSRIAGHYFQRAFPEHERTQSNGGWLVRPRQRSQLRCGGTEVAVAV
jgi:hypothetical protein